MNFFPLKNNTITSQNILLSSWIILYVIYKPCMNTEQHHLFDDS
jgi:hypothetical protein